MEDWQVQLFFELLGPIFILAILIAYFSFAICCWRDGEEASAQYPVYAHYPEPVYTQRPMYATHPMSNGNVQYYASPMQGAYPSYPLQGSYPMMHQPAYPMMHQPTYPKLPNQSPLYPYPSSPVQYH